jgi:hypothetical protein
MALDVRRLLGRVALVQGVSLVERMALDVGAFLVPLVPLVSLVKRVALLLIGHVVLLSKSSTILESLDGRRRSDLPTNH